jgi:hypothetical protein
MFDNDRAFLTLRLGGDLDVSFTGWGGGTGTGGIIGCWWGCGGGRWGGGVGLGAGSLDDALVPG